MKYFFIVDDSGNAIYFNHPGGTMIALPFAVAQNFAHENFGDSCSSIDCEDGTRFAFDKYESLSLLVVSDEGENEAFLRSQLSLARELLFLEYSPALLTDKAKITSGYFQSPQLFHRMTTIIDTMCYMCSHKQSFLVQSIEELLAHSTSSDVKDNAVNILKQSIGNFPQMQHALLFVGTKLLAEYRRPKSKHLSSKDIFLLTLFYCSHFHPKVLRRVQAILEAKELLENISMGIEGPESTPVTNLLDEENIRNKELQLSAKFHLEEMRETFVSNGGLPLGFEGPFVEVLQIILKFLGSYSGKIDGNFSATVKAAISTHSRQEDPAKITSLESLKDLLHVAQEHLQQRSTTTTAATSSPASPARGVPQEQNIDNTEAVDALRVGVKLISEVVAEPITPSLTPSSSTGSISTLDSSSEARNAYEPQIRYNPLSQEDDEEELSGRRSPFSSAAIRARMISRLKSQSPPKADRVYQQVFLSSNDYKPMCLYCAKLFDRITLVVVTNSSQTSEAERKELLKVESTVAQSALVNNYSSYLLSMENSHTMISYVHLLPGLCHFIFVDRTNNRILAPDIDSLIGISSRYNTNLGRSKMSSILKRYIWEMCYQSYEALSRGCFDMVMKYGDFQFSYKLWFVDSNGMKISLGTADTDDEKDDTQEHQSRESSPRIRRVNASPSYTPPKDPITREFYKKLQSQLFPGQRVRCYELFTLYVGSISLKLVDQYSNHLVSMIMGKDAADDRKSSR